MKPNPSPQIQSLLIKPSMRPGEAGSATLFWKNAILTGAQKAEYILLSNSYEDISLTSTVGGSSPGKEDDNYGRESYRFGP
jgi:hypothetical protein